ncbi:hypothetical protein EDD15DRAFT_2524120 [Pisolithus albus]|nr:hypothetical protein EDD15DRAFT_2524120 [Pisolithus albus]
MTSSNVRSVFGVLVGDFKRSANALGVSSGVATSGERYWKNMFCQPAAFPAGRACTNSNEGSLDSSCKDRRTADEPRTNRGRTADEPRRSPPSSSRFTLTRPTCDSLALSASSFGDASLRCLCILAPCIYQSCSGYSDYLREYILQRSTGYVYALSQWNSHNLHIQQAVDVQCAGPPTSRVPFSTVKLAVGSTAHVFKDIIILRAFGDYIFLVLDGPASRQTTTPLDQRDWVTRYISQRSSMEDRFADVRMAWSFSVSQTASYPSLSISSPDDIPDAGHSFEQNMEYLTNECRAAQFKNRGDTTYLVPDTASNKIWNNLRTARCGDGTGIIWKLWLSSMILNIWSPGRMMMLGISLSIDKVGVKGIRRTSRGVTWVVTWANTVTSECAGESNE